MLCLEPLQPPEQPRRPAPSPSHALPGPAWPWELPGGSCWLNKGCSRKALSAKLSAPTNIWKPEEAGRGACPTPPGGPGSFCALHIRLHILPPQGKPLSSPRFLYPINTSLPHPTEHPCFCHHQTTGPGCLLPGGHHQTLALVPLGTHPPQMHFLSTLPRGIDTHCPHPGSRAGCERVPSGSSEHLILLVSVTGSGTDG